MLKILAIVLALAAFAASAQAQMMQKSVADRQYLQAMEGMDRAMMHAHLSGNADRDFITLMIAHHQAAIDMANTERKYGKDARIRDSGGSHHCGTDTRDRRDANVASKHEVVPARKIATVNTSLQMFVKPPSRASVHEPAWSLARVTMPETNWYRDLFRRIGEPYLWYSRLALNEAELREILDDARVEVYAFRAGDRDEGLVELDFRESRTCELTFFGVTQAFVGTGAGRWLMNRAVEFAWSHPIRRFWVHTCTLDHPSALRFYQRSGFTAFARDVEVADDPRLTGLLAIDAAPDIPLLQ